MEKINTRLAVYDLKGEIVDHIQLDEKLFNGYVNETLLYGIKKMYEANIRAGRASTKKRDEVAGGGIKPWRQKGTGRARAGSIRSPLWRHGGVVFGPCKNRDFSYTMPKKACAKALLSSLNIRLAEHLIKPVVKIEFSEPKTKEAKCVLENLKTDGKILLVVTDMSRNTKLSFRNLKKVSLKEARNINARDILLNDCLVIEKEAFEKLVERVRF